MTTGIQGDLPWAANLGPMNEASATEWESFRQRFQLFCDAYLPDKTSDKRKIAILLHHMGETGLQVYNTFSLDKEGQTLKDILEKFDAHFVPRVNTTYERYLFFNRKQQDGETYEQYLTVLKNLSKSCDFQTLKLSLIKDAFVSGIKDPSLREMLLNTKDLDPEKAMELCRTREMAQRQTKFMDTAQSEQIEVDALQRNRMYSCKRCGRKHLPRSCPAFGRECRKCGAIGHFSNMCRTNRGTKEANSQGSPRSGNTFSKRLPSRESKCLEVNKEVKEESQEEEEFYLDEVKMDENIWLEKLGINDREIEIKVDSGAQCNILSYETFERLRLNKNLIHPTKTRITSFSNHMVELIGKIKINSTYKANMFELEFFIVNNCRTNILGLKSCLQLGIIKRVDQLEEINERFHCLFDGKVGKIPIEVDLKLQKGSQPVVLPPRKIPFALYPKVKEELEEMVRQKIIKRVDYPTDWVSQMVIVQKPKSNKLRICLDPRPLNKVLKRSHFKLPTLDEMLSQTTGAKYFTKLDALKGFWLLPLNEKSSNYCTFNSPFGRFKFLRLPYGLNCASEIFHKTISDIFHSCEGVVSFQDDILIYAPTKEILKNRTDVVLNLAAKWGLKFNKDKCQFNVNEITFLGHKMTNNGLKVDEEKLKAITCLQPPSDKKALQRILGMFNYLSKFIPNYSDLTKPLRNLLKKDALFYWDENLSKNFEIIKTKLVKAPTLAIYDPNKEIRLSVDASSVGLGAVVLQNGKPLAYASKALTETQQRYAQIEKEMLAIVFGVEKFDQFLYGREIVIETDHKPLIAIQDKPLNRVPIRLQRMMLKLQPYTFKLIYKPGKEMIIPDVLSRDFNENSVDKITPLEKEIDVQIHLLVNNLPVSKNTFKLIQESYSKDENIAQLKEYIVKGWPKHKKDVRKELLCYFDYKHDLNIVQNIIFKNNLILIPQNLVETILKKLHVGHPGIVRMKARAKTCVFWPKIGEQIEVFCKRCDICAKYQCSNQKSAMIIRDPPNFPWEDVGADVFEFKKKYFLVVVDYLSNYIEVAQLSNLTTTTIINKLKPIFARHGIPLKFFTDGAPYFTSAQFKEFSKQWDFNHITSSPHFPKSNGMAESAVKTIKNIFKKSQETGEDINLALLYHRTTPRTEMPAPSEIIMNRILRSNIPQKLEQLIPSQPHVNMEALRKQWLKTRQNAKINYDKTAKVKENKYVTGQSIMYKKMPDSKWSKGKIIEVHNTPRSYQILDENGDKFRRNTIFIKPRVNNADDIPTIIDPMEQSLSDSTQEVIPDFDNYTTRFGRKVKAVKPST